MTSAVSKHYGSARALDGVDLVVPQGSVYGFLGPNGAGKTTMLRLITGLSRPTSGSVRVLGQDVSRPGRAWAAQVGYLPDVPGFYEWMTAPEFLRFAGQAFGLDRGVLDERVDMLLDLAGLSGVRTRIGGFSRGMKQRLGVAQALVNAPSLLLLDEPTSALDPMGRRDVLDMLTSLRGRTTVFFSTHILSDVERVCDTVAILDRGKVLAQGPIAEVTGRYGAQSIVLEVTDQSDAIAGDLGAQPWAAAIVPGPGGGLRVTVRDLGAALHAVPAIVAERGVGLARLEVPERGLEEVFVDLIDGGRE